MKKWILIPHRSVGGICFGHNISEYMKDYDLVYDRDSYIESDDKVISYINKSNTVRVDTYSGIIESISSYKDIWFNEKNIVGMSLTFVELFFSNYELCIDCNDGELYRIGNEDQYIIVVKGMGINLWISEDRHVASVDCYSELDS